MNELAIAGVTSGQTAFCQIRRSIDEKIWSVTGVAFETYSNAHEITGNYDISLVEQGTSGYYVGDFDSHITTSGTYNLAFYTRTGTSGSYVYAFVTAGALDWTGSEVSSDPTGLNWISRDQYKTFWQITSTATDAQIDAAIPYISAWCNRYTDRTIKETAKVKVFRGRKSAKSLNLGDFPVTLTSVTFDYGDNSPTVYADSNFYVNEVGSVRFLLNSTNIRPFDSELIQVSYTSGYAAGQIPQELQLAAILLLHSYLSMTDPDSLIQQRTAKEAQETWNNTYLMMSNPNYQRATEILDSHKMPELYI